MRMVGRGGGLLFLSGSAWGSSRVDSDGVIV